VKVEAWERTHAQEVPMLILALSTAHAADVPPHAEERAERALDAVKATEEQRSAFWKLFEETVPKMKALHDEAHALRDELKTVLLVETIDRAALEDLRVDAVDLFDRGTQVVFAHVADVAELFTVPQRQAFFDFHEQMRHRFGPPGPE
jgi:Spy/CpxP family protein refolding chaperone